MGTGFLAQTWEGIHSKAMEAEQRRKKKRQETCVHPDGRVAIICLECLSHLEKNGEYVARRKGVL